MDLNSPTSRSLRARAFDFRRAGKKAAISTWGQKPELVKRRHRLDPKAAVDENAPRRRGRVTAFQEIDTTSGRVDAASARACLQHARARRIDERRVERSELMGSQRTAEKIARLCGELAQARASSRPRA